MDPNDSMDLNHGVCHSEIPANTTSTPPVSLNSEFPCVQLNGNHPATIDVSHSVARTESSQLSTEVMKINANSPDNARSIEIPSSSSAQVPSRLTAGSPAVSDCPASVRVDSAASNDSYRAASLPPDFRLQDLATTSSPPPWTNATVSTLQQDTLNSSTISHMVFSNPPSSVLTMHTGPNLITSILPDPLPASTSVPMSVSRTSPALSTYLPSQLANSDSSDIYASTFKHFATATSKSDQHPNTSQSAFPFLPASINSAALPKTFPFTLMPLTSNGDFPAVQLTLPDLPAVILQVLPLPGAKMGEQYTINVPTPLILSGINSALANGGTVNGGPIMLSIAPSGAYPQSNNFNNGFADLATNGTPSLNPESFNGITLNNSTSYLPTSLSNLSNLDVSAPLLQQLGVQTTSNAATKRMRAIAPKPCYPLPNSLQFNPSALSTRGPNHGRGSRKHGSVSIGSAVIHPLSCTPGTATSMILPAISSRTKSSVTGSKSNRGRRKNTAISITANPTCSTGSIIMASNQSCPTSITTTVPFSDMNTAQSITHSANFSNQSILLPNPSAPVMSGPIIPSDQLPPGFLLGSTFQSGSNPNLATPYLLPAAFSFQSGCPTYSGSIYSSSTCSTTNGMAPLPVSSATALFNTGVPSIAAVDPATGVVTHYPSCVPMAGPDCSSTDQQPFIVYSQQNPNALGFLLPTTSQPGPLVYPISGQPLLPRLPSSSMIPTTDGNPQSTSTLVSGESMSLGVSLQSTFQSITPAMHQPGMQTSYIASISNNSTNGECNLALQSATNRDQIPNVNALAKDDLISIAWRLTQMDDVLGEESSLNQTDGNGETDFFNNLVSSSESEKQMDSHVNTCGTEIVLLDNKDAATPTTTQSFATSSESTGNADIDALLAVAAMVGAASGVGDARSSVTVPIPSSFSNVTVSDIHSSSQTMTSAGSSVIVTSSFNDVPIVTSQQTSSVHFSSVTVSSTNNSTTVLNSISQDPLSCRDPTELLPNTLFDEFTDTAYQKPFDLESTDMIADLGANDDPNSLAAVLGVDADDAVDLESVLGANPHELNESGSVTESFLNSLVGPTVHGDLEDLNEDANLFDTNFDVATVNSPGEPPDADALAEVDIAVSQSLATLSENFELDYDSFTENRRVDSLVTADDTPVPSSHQVRSLFQNTVPFRFGPANMALTSEENSVFTKLFESNPPKSREDRSTRFIPDVPDDLLSVEFPDVSGEYTTAEQFDEALLLLGPPPSPGVKSTDAVLKEESELSSDIHLNAPKTVDNNSNVTQELDSGSVGLVQQETIYNSPNKPDFSENQPNVVSSSSTDPTHTNNASLTSKSVVSSDDSLTECMMQDEVQSPESVVHATITANSANTSLADEEFDGDETVPMTLGRSTEFVQDAATDCSSDIDNKLRASEKITDDSVDDFAIPTGNLASTPTCKSSKRLRKTPTSAADTKSIEISVDANRISTRSRSKTQSTDENVGSANSQLCLSPSDQMTSPIASDASNSEHLSVHVSPCHHPDNTNILGVLASSALLEAAVGSLESDSDISPVKSLHGLATLDRMLKRCQRRSQQDDQSKSSSAITSSGTTSTSHLSETTVSLSLDPPTEPSLASVDSKADSVNPKSATKLDLNTAPEFELPESDSLGTFQSFSLSHTFERPRSFGFNTDVTNATSQPSLPGSDFTKILPRLDLHLPGRLFPEASQSPDEDDPLPAPQFAPVADEPKHKRRSKTKRASRVRCANPITEKQSPESNVPHTAGQSQENLVATDPFSKFAESSSLPSFVTIQQCPRNAESLTVKSECQSWTKTPQTRIGLFEEFMGNKDRRHATHSAAASLCGASDSTDNTSLSPADAVSAPALSVIHSTAGMHSPLSTPNNLPITVCCGFSAPAFSTMYNSNASLSGVTSLTSTPNPSSSPFNTNGLAVMKPTANLVSPSATTLSCTSAHTPSSSSSFHGIWPPPAFSDALLVGGKASSTLSLAVPSLTFGSFAGAAAFRSTTFSALAAKAQLSIEKQWCADALPTFSDLAKVSTSERSLFTKSDVIETKSSSPNSSPTRKPTVNNDSAQDALDPQTDITQPIVDTSGDSNPAHSRVIKRRGRRGRFKFGVKRTAKKTKLCSNVADAKSTPLSDKDKSCGTTSVDLASSTDHPHQEGSNSSVSVHSEAPSDRLENNVSVDQASLVTDSQKYLSPDPVPTISENVIDLTRSPTTPQLSRPTTPTYVSMESNSRAGIETLTSSPQNVSSPTKDGLDVPSTETPAISKPPILLRLNLKSTTRSRATRKKNKSLDVAGSSDTLPVIATSTAATLSIRLKRDRDASWGHAAQFLNDAEPAVAPPVKLLRKSSSTSATNQTEDDGAPTVANSLTIKLALRGQTAGSNGRCSTSVLHSSRLSSVFSKKIFSTAKQDRRSNYAHLARPWRIGFTGYPRKRGSSKYACLGVPRDEDFNASTDSNRLNTNSKVIRGSGKRRGRPPSRMRFGDSHRGRSTTFPHESSASEQAQNENSRSLRLVIRLGKKPSSSPVEHAAEYATASPSVSRQTLDDSREFSSSSPPEQEGEEETNESSVAEPSIQFCLASEAETYMDPNQVQIQRVINHAVNTRSGVRGAPTFFHPPGDEDDDGGGGQALHDHHHSLASSEFIGAGRLCERYSILPSVDAGSQGLCPQVKSSVFQPASSVMSSDFALSRSRAACEIKQFTRQDGSRLSSVPSARHPSEPGSLSSPCQVRSTLETDIASRCNFDPMNARSEEHHSIAPASAHPVEGRNSSSTSSIVSVPPLLPSTDSPAPPSLGFNSDNPLDTSYGSIYQPDETAPRHSGQTSDATKEQRSMNDLDSPYSKSYRRNSSGSNETLAGHDAQMHRNSQPTASSKAVHQQALALAAAAAYASLDPVMAAIPQAKAYYDQWASSLFNSCWPTSQAHAPQGGPQEMAVAAVTLPHNWTSSDQEIPRFGDWSWVNPNPAHASSDINQSLRHKRASQMHAYLHPEQSNQSDGTLPNPQLYQNTSHFEGYNIAPSFPSRSSHRRLMDYGSTGSSTLSQPKPQINGW